MRFILFILFVAMPFIELALLIGLGQHIGFWPTIGIVMFTAILGAYVLHAQGIATLHRISASMSSGEPPVKAVVDGFFLAISGAFLLTPGVVTDSIGLLLLVPPMRHAIARWAFHRMAKSGSFTIHTYSSEAGDAPPRPRHSGPAQDRTASPGRPSPRSTGGAGPVIDGEFEEIKKK
jgi:UPF0716 protein FxsA